MADPTTKTTTSTGAAAPPDDSTQKVAPPTDLTGSAASWKLRFHDDTPDSLIPKMGQYKVSNAAYYQQLIIDDPGMVGSPTDQEIQEPLDPFAKVDAPNTPLQGVLLTFEQGWIEKGTALGRLEHSICLAPGEVTRVAMIEWKRQSTASSSTSGSLSDSVGAATDQGTAMNAVQTAVERESASGMSSVFSVAAQAEAGVSVGFLGSGASASASTSTSLGLAASVSQGERDVSASAVKNINQRTVQTSQAVRSRRSFEIQEMSQNEAKAATTRVLANYNHMHALTMMYFEVLQVFQLQTTVVRAERCVFVPMKVVDFDAAWISANLELLLGIVKSLGHDALYQALLSYGKGAVDLGTRLADAQAEVTKAGQAVMKGEEDAMAKRLQSGFGDLQQAYANLQTSQQKWSAIKAAQDLFARDVVAILMSEQLLINQLIWMRLDPYRLRLLLHGKRFRGRPLERVDPRPLGVFGGYLALRWPFHEQAAAEETAFRAKYEGAPDGVPEASVAVPSGGFFGEAVLGQAISAEKIDLTRFWNWKDSPIPILPPEMEKISLASNPSDVKFSNPDFSASLAHLKDVPIPPGSELDQILSVVSKDSGFQNKSKEELLGKVLTGAQAAVQAGAAAAGENAVTSSKNFQDFVVGLANSKAGETLSKAAATVIAPEGEAATMLGGLANLAGEAKPVVKAAAKATGAGDKTGGNPPAKTKNP